MTDEQRRTTTNNDEQPAVFGDKSTVEGPVAAYCRVSTPDQDLTRQAKTTLPYARNTLGAGLGGVDVTDAADHLENVGGNGEPIDLGDVTVFHDKSTGTDTNRRGYQQVMRRVESGEFAALVIHDLTRLTRSLQDLEQTVERVTSHGCELHFVRDGLPPFTPDADDPGARLMLQMLGAFAEWEARTKRMNTKEGIQARMEADDDYHHGRPPIGFEKEDGHLYRDENYDDVVATLDMVLKGTLSKRKAADDLNTTRATIRNALERREMYGI
jgi:DNA invertase Pin-like site-specific DNA recombinase